MNSTQTARWSWKSEPELMARLLAVQNTEKQQHQDIMTIVGFFSTREQLEAHVVRYEVGR
jgi:hypothetical protein